MCGLTGFIDADGAMSADAMRAIVGGMAEAIRHRGPDDEGCWVDPAAGVALGFRRLAIVDLSEAGHQPMTSASGRFVMVFNGEIYNYRAIRGELEQADPGIVFRGRSDTEVLLAAIERWGPAGTIGRTVGMFAIALWDRRERKLLLIRDRLGEKPLYYGWVGRTFMFGSELKALRAHPAFSAEIDRDAVALFLHHKYIPTPHSIYRGIAKLTQGTILTLDPSRPGEMPEPKPYWSVRDAAEAGMANGFRGTEGEAVDHLEALLRESVRLQMVADVPLGALLSGGVDSSMVVALLQAQSERPVETFTIGFEERGYNEAEHAKMVAEHLGTLHRELYVTPSEAMTVIPRLPTLYDEPFADASQIPTFLVAQMARRHVTVGLSGDGGDELFAGYVRHQTGSRLWRKVGRAPRGVRRLAANCVTAIPPDGWDRVLDVAGPALPASLRGRVSGDWLHKGARVLHVSTPEDMYRLLVTDWADTDRVVLGAQDAASRPLAERHRTEGFGPIERMMYLDTVMYMPDDVLVKVDRASMGVGLEVRTPFLDHRVFEFAWRLPMRMKIRDGHGKWVLRQVLYRYVPRDLVERPKMGFGVPVGAWLRGPLRPWAEELLDPQRLRADGLLNPAAVQAKWDEHQSGRRDWHAHLWDVLMLQAWLREQPASGAVG
ncbi:MAG: asparagine synthase (glutamine-hydrolyzing) [Thermomicrobiales bacterium]|nr:asparagine synthase (glutamine-hydrolyzing) [Thermomicrobiales bacterium]